MGGQNTKKNITVGLLAHVDAGKTTLTECLLFNSGAIRKLGRVDHRDTFLDTDPVERERGITVYSKTARLNIGDTEITLLDTPGHADLSPEMERTLWILDYAVLIISAQEGVTVQSKLLWKLLEHYNVPAFIFVNKMDRPDADGTQILDEIKSELGGACVDFSDTKSDDFKETIALTDERLLERFLGGEDITDDDVAEAVKKREVYPVYFGSALKNEGIDELIKGMADFMKASTEKSSFSARVYKISRDNKGERLAWIKVTGGTLSVKQPVKYKKNDEMIEEKINQIRLYSGVNFTQEQSVSTGSICALTGLSAIKAGEVLGDDVPLKTQIIEPVLTYELEYDADVLTTTVLDALRKIEEEEPKLHVKFSEKTGRISVHVMGQVQMEILKRQLKERFSLSIRFGSQTIIYKETVTKTTEGVGHFEPLRHYAEVRVLIEPLPKGSGVQFENRCSRDELDPHWQRLIMSHLNERTLTGVLTDSDLTDIRISLLGGRAHTKHTEPGDFRQAVFRAVRQGLMENVSVLLEPYYDFVLTLPEANLGRALFDINQMGAVNEAPEIENGECTIKGRGPASALGNYQETLTLYTAGKGRLSCSFNGYEACTNASEVIESIGYDPDRDVDNPSSSVFCSHGAGIIVPWYSVKEKMHTASTADYDVPDSDEYVEEDGFDITEVKRKREELKDNLTFKEKGARIVAAEKELQEIFNRTYGSKGEPASRPGWKRSGKNNDIFAPVKSRASKKIKPGKEYLLVDGYNIIFAWEELKELVKSDIGAARDKLIDILSEYHGMRSGDLILVFDAYKVAGGKESVSKYHNIYVVYTKESETADQYIEKTVHDLGKNNHVTVATSDGLEQMIILGEGAVRMSAAGLLEDIENSRKTLREEYLVKTSGSRSGALDGISDEVREVLNRLDED